MNANRSVDLRPIASSEDPAYVFHHFIKCGGTTVTEVLRSWFNIVNDHFVTFDELEEYKNRRIDLKNLKAGDCVVGHYAVEGTYLFERYPELIGDPSRFRIITFLRDPLEFCISFYFYSKKEGRTNQTLREFLESNRNLIAYYFPCYYDCKEVMNRYYFIGIAERMEESLGKPAAMLNKDMPEIRKLNETERDKELEITDDSFRKWFRTYNDIDCRIYEYACSLLDERKLLTK